MIINMLLTVYRKILKSKIKTIINSFSTIGPAAKEQFSEIEEAVRLFYGKTNVSSGDKRFLEQLILADDGFFRVFSFPVIEGSAKGILRSLDKAAVTRSFADKMFGEENPIGKTITLNNTVDVTVMAVLADIPENSHFKFEILSSTETLKSIYGDSFNNGFLANTYLLFKKGTDPEEFAKKLPAFTIRMFGKEKAKRRSYYIQNIATIHLHSNAALEMETNGSVRTLYYLSALAVILMIIACINFMNLATAVALERAKEVGIRKAIGASRRQIIQMMLCESVLISMISVLCAIVLTEFFLPVFNSLVGRNVEFSIQNDFPLVFYFTGLTILTGLIAGSYPAFIISGFRPVSVLKGKLQIRLSSISVRKLLIIIQFAVSAIFITGTCVLYLQLNFINRKDLGFEKDNIVIIPKVENNEERSLTGSFRQELMKNSHIRGVTAADSYPGSRACPYAVSPEGKTGRKPLILSGWKRIKNI